MPESTLNDAIVTYLETFGQPQFVWSIRDALLEQGVSVEDGDLTPYLDDLAKAKTIRAVDGGVNAAGVDQTMYAPHSFKA